MFRVLFSVWFSIQSIIKKKTTCSVWFRIQRIIHRIQRIIQNTTCSVWFRIIKKCPGYYSPYVSVFRVSFKIRPAASGSGFRVLLKMSRVLFNVWFIIQGIIQNTTCSVWFSIQGIIQNTTCSVLFRIQGIIKNCPGYYSAYGSVFRVLFKIRPAASGSGFNVLCKTIQGIIQRLVHYSGYYSEYDLQHLVQYSCYYSKYDLQRLVQDSRYY